MIEFGSFVKLDKQKVIEMCEIKIERINNRRKEKDKKLLEKTLEAINLCRFTRLNIFGMFRKVSIEELKTSPEKYLAYEDYPSHYAWLSLDVCEKLLKIAKQSEDFVYVTAEDFSHIF